MTRKDYVATASALASVRPPMSSKSRVGWEDAIAAIMSVFANDNPGFDRGRFMDACGIEED